MPLVSEVNVASDRLSADKAKTVPDASRSSTIALSDGLVLSISIQASEPE